MGTRGPIPKREEGRRRRNKTDSSGESNEVEHLVVDPADLEDPERVGIPDPNLEWNPLALMLYESVKLSAVSFLYEPSDWAVFFIALDQLSKNLEPQPVVVQSGPNAGQVVMVDVPMNGSTYAALSKTFTSLMLTEGDRRRLKLEIERKSGLRAGEASRPTGDNVIDIRRDRLSG